MGRSSCCSSRDLRNGSSSFSLPILKSSATQLSVAGEAGSASFPVYLKYAPLWLPRNWAVRSLVSNAADLAGVLVPGRIGDSRGRTLRHTYCAIREWLRASPVPAIRPGSNEKKLAACG